MLTAKFCNGVFASKTRMTALYTKRRKNRRYIWPLQYNSSVWRTGMPKIRPPAVNHTPPKNHITYSGVWFEVAPLEYPKVDCSSQKNNVVFGAGEGWMRMYRQVLLRVCQQRADNIKTPRRIKTYECKYEFKKNVLITWKDVIQSTVIASLYRNG